MNETCSCSSRLGRVLRHPAAVAALGEVLTERSGVLNLGVEGMISWAPSWPRGIDHRPGTGGWWFSMAISASVAGLLTALVHAFLSSR